MYNYVYMKMQIHPEDAKLLREIKHLEAIIQAYDNRSGCMGVLYDLFIGEEYYEEKRERLKQSRLEYTR